MSKRPLKDRVRRSMATAILIEPELNDELVGTPDYVFDQITEDMSEMLVEYTRKFARGWKEHRNNIDSYSLDELQRHADCEDLDRWAYRCAIKRKIRNELP